MSDKFWETPEWIRTKTLGMKTDKLLTKIEYLKYVGAKNFTEEGYKKYLEIMQQPEEREPEFIYKNYYETED
jgi:hypothetical protein